jgi:superfamily II DNA or RNA helicase
MKVEFLYDSKRKEVKIVSDYLNNIKEHFSVKNPGARFNRYQKFLPQRIYAITNSGYCGVGLVPEIYDFLNSQTIPFNVIFNQEYKNVLQETHILTPGPLVKKLKSKFELRDYQQIAVKEALKHGYGVVELATGGGKTLIIANLVYASLWAISLLEKVLIVVPDLGLVTQTFKDFESYNFPMHLVSRWTGDTELDPDARVIIANMGILQSKSSDITWFNKVGLLVVDECHKLRRGNKVCKLIDKIPTLRRIGFTGTLPENNIDKWNINNYLGPVIFKKTTTELREAAGGEYIANAQCLAIKVNYEFKPDYTSVPSSQRYFLELDYIHNNSFRNKIIKQLASSFKNNCLILVDHIAHGDNLYKELSMLIDKQVFFIQGSVEVEDRRNVQEIMEKHDNVVCIAISKIFSTGISIKNIHYIMFAAGGKSKIKTLQSIGRGLRVHENKDVLTLLDVVDELIYGTKHYEKRKEFYALEKIKITEKRITESTTSG